MADFYYSAFRQLAHNGRLIQQAENILNNAIRAGIKVWIENPDGTKVTLQEGFVLGNLEIIKSWEKQEEII